MSFWDTCLAPDQYPPWTDKSPEAKARRQEFEWLVETEPATQEQLRTVLLRAAELEATLPQAGELINGIIFRADIGDDLLRECLEREIGMGPLVHRRGPRWLLWRFADEFRPELLIPGGDYHFGRDEAVLTLALDYYKDPETSVAEFEAFMARFWKIADRRHFKSVKPSDPAKAEVVANYREPQRAFDAECRKARGLPPPGPRGPHWEE